MAHFISDGRKGGHNKEKHRTCCEFFRSRSHSHTQRKAPGISERETERE